MNCKQGDLALIIRSTAGNEGLVVTCLEFVGGAGYLVHNGKPYKMNGDCWWKVDRKLNMSCDDEIFHDCAPYCRDDCMMPIGNTKTPEAVKEQEGEPA